jgi:hypothetical protein
VLALGWYVSRFQRFCRFAAREILTDGKAFRQRAFALTNGKAFRQRAFALKSVNVINERLLSD